MDRIAVDHRRAARQIACGGLPCAADGRGYDDHPETWSESADSRSAARPIRSPPNRQDRLLRSHPRAALI